MKKINSIKQLQIEKNRIIQHQEELENKIRGNWKELKVSLKPEKFIHRSDNRPEGKSVERRKCLKKIIYIRGFHAG
jgi:hypothetical protein